jgi:hypothetical protein
LIVRTPEDAGYYSVIRRNDATHVQGEHDPAVAHDGASEAHSDQRVLVPVVHPVDLIWKQFHIAFASNDVGHVTGPQRWIDTIEMVILSNRNDDCVTHLCLLFCAAAGLAGLAADIASGHVSSVPEIADAFFQSLTRPTTSSSVLNGCSQYRELSRIDIVAPHESQRCPSRRRWQ